MYVNRAAAPACQISVLSANDVVNFDSAYPGQNARNLRVFTAAAVDMYETGRTEEQIEAGLREAASTRANVTLKPGTAAGGTFLSNNWNTNTFAQSKYSSHLAGISK